MNKKKKFAMVTMVSNEKIQINLWFWMVITNIQYPFSSFEHVSTLWCDKNKTTKNLETTNTNTFHCSSIGSLKTLVAHLLSICDVN